MCFAGLSDEPFHFQRYVKREILQLSHVFSPSLTSKMSLQRFSSSLSLESYLRDSSLKPSKPIVMAFFSFEIAFFTSRWLRGSWLSGCGSCLSTCGCSAGAWILGWPGRSCSAKCCSRCFLGFSGGYTSLLNLFRQRHLTRDPELCFCRLCS